MKKKALSNLGLILALVSAFFCAFNIIIQKKYVDNLSSNKILFLMYLGAGVGLFIIHLFTKSKYKEKEKKITKKEVPRIIIIVVCELLASFSIIEAIKRIDASLISLLSIFEIVMTSLYAYLLFHDEINRNEIIAIILVLIGSFVLNFKNGILSSITINSLLVIFACICWGLGNNVTASISSKEPAFFTSIKCSSVSLLYLILVIIEGDLSMGYPILILLGFFSYGFSVLAYALSTKYLGASKATLVFSFSSIFGVLLAVIIYKEQLSLAFIISAVLMVIGILFMNKDVKNYKKTS